MKILIEVSGGCVQSVKSSEDVEVILVDYDNNSDGEMDTYPVEVVGADKIQEIIDDIPPNGEDEDGTTDLGIPWEDEEEWMEHLIPWEDEDE
jgi:hypothetical protein